MAETQEDRERTIDIIIQGHAAVKPAVEEVSKELAAFQKRMQKMREDEAAETERIQKMGILGRLKEGLGGRSDFKESFELLKGGGAVAGLTLAGRAINDMVQGAIQLRNEFNSGTISAGEMTEKLLGQIPVYGQIWQAGRGIREILTGELAEIERIKKESELVNSVFDNRKKLVEAINKGHEASIEKIKEYRREAELAAAPEGRREGILAGFTRDDNVAAADKRAADRLAVLEQQRANIRSLEKQLAAVAMPTAKYKTTIAGEELENRDEIAAAASLRARLSRQISEQQKLIVDDEKAIQADRQAERREALIKGMREENEAGRKFYEERVKQQESFAAKLADMEAKERETRLKAMGLDYEAQLEQATAARQKALDELQKDAEAVRKKLDPSDTRGFNELGAAVDFGKRIIEAQHRADVMQARADEQKRREDAAEKVRREQEKMAQEAERAAREEQRDREDAVGILFRTADEYREHSRTRMANATADADTNVTLSGVSAAARERSFLQTDDGEKKLWEAERRERQRLHDEEMKKLEKWFGDLIGSVQSLKETAPALR